MAVKTLSEIIKGHLEKNQNFLLDPHFKQLHRFIIEDVEKTVIEFALEKSNHSNTKAAEFLGISRSTLIRKIKQYKIKP